MADPVDVSCANTPSSYGYQLTMLLPIQQPPPAYDVTTDPAWREAHHNPFGYNTFGGSDAHSQSQSNSPQSPGSLVIGVLLFLGFVSFMFWTWGQFQRDSWHP
jgi:hypothetical protein